jgi:peroxiredoxin
MAVELLLLISSILLWLAVGFNLLLTVALIRRQQRAAKRPELLPAGAEAPPFTAETTAGEKVTLADFNGAGELALVFVSPTCTPCLQKIPFFNNLYPAARRAGVELILVSDSDRKAARSFVTEHEVTLPVIAAPRPANPFLEQYKITGTPTYYLLDRERKVKASGFLDGEWHELTAKWIAA